MNKEKRSAIVLTILTIVFTLGAAALLYVTMAFGLGKTMDDVIGSLTGVLEPLKGMFDFGAVSTIAWNGIPFLLIYYIVAMVLAALWFIFWIVHLVVLIAKRRPGALFTNIIWLIFGAASIFVMFLCVARVGWAGYIFEGTIEGIVYHDYFEYILASWMKNWVGFACALGLGVVAVLAYCFGFSGLVKSLKDVIKNPGVKKVKDSVIEEENQQTFETNDKDYVASLPGEEENAPAADKDAIRSYQYAELDNAKKEPKKEEEKVLEGKGGPVIVQHISYANPEAKEEKPAAATVPPYPYPPYPYYPYAPFPYPYPPFMAQPQPEKKEEKKEEPAPAPEEPKPSVTEDRPLTAKELRAIMREELSDHDHPEELEPLTDEQARNLIKEELQNYYAGTLPKEEPATEAPVAPAPEEEEIDEDDLMTSDDLRDLIKETVQSTLAETPKEEPAPIETLKADEVRQVVAEELEKQPKPVEGLKADEVRQVVAEELEKQPKPAEALKAEDIRAIVREEIEANKVEPTDSEAVLSTKEMVAENNASIKEAAEKQLTSEEVRTLIAEELAKYFAENKVVAQEEKPVEEKKETPTVVVNLVQTPEKKAEEKEEVKEEPKEEVAEEVAEEAAPKAAIVRIPFSERMLNMDEDSKDNYNELKAEALAYGLKSRISNSGDTFRLHTKTYLKIGVAGKGLKLYFALDPKDYRDTPIPVKDVGAKNVYKDIPLCFKVKSALSLKRAKQLIADVAAKDHLEKKEVTPYDYLAQLRDYHESKAEGDGEDED